MPITGADDRDDGEPKQQRRRRAEADRAAATESDFAQEMPPCPPTVDDLSAGLVKARLRQRLFGVEPDPVQLGRFQVLDRVGAGGMSVVFRAMDPQLGRAVALKVLRAERRRAGHQRLLREARAMAALSHPNVVAVHEVGTVADGSVFIAMELCEGPTLDAWLAAEPRTRREILAAFLAAGRGLAAAHDIGLVHRDFKPANAVFGKDERVRVLDFGLVRNLGSAADAGADEPADRAAPAASAAAEQLTVTGTIMGTPAYMAPEQFLGSDADARSDQFSFCVALFEALAEMRPFAGDTADELRRNALAGNFPAATETARMPGWVRTILLRGLSAEPSQRYPSMHQLLAALASDPAETRKRRLIGAGIATVLAALAVVAVYGLSRSRESHAVDCGAAPAKLTGVWDEDARRAVRHAFSASGRPRAQSTHERVDQALDQYAQNWVSMRVQACAATYRDREQSEELLDLRMHCLDRRLADLGAAVEVFAGEVDDGLLDRASRVISSLPDLADCADQARLRARVPPPGDPAVREAVDAVHERLARASALHASGKYTEGLRVASAAVDGARQTRYAPVLAQALFVLGRLQRAGGQFDAAEATFRETGVAAAEARDDRLGADALIELLRVVGYSQAHPMEAHVLRPAVETAVMRAGNTPALQSRLAFEWCTILRREERYQEALEYGKRALALKEEAPGSDDSGLAAYLHLIGDLHFRVGDYERSRELLERSVALNVKALGDDHPTVGAAHGALGNVLALQGHFEEARHRQEKYLAIIDAAYGQGSRQSAAALNDLGVTLFRQQKYDEAMGYFQRALHVDEKHLGRDHVDVGINVNNLAKLLMAQEKNAEAIPYLQRALAIYEESYGAEHALSLELNRRLAYCHALIDPGEGIAYYERQLARLGETAKPLALADLRVDLSRLLWTNGGDRRRAVALARKARDAYATGTTESARKAHAELDAWLASVDR